LLFFLRADYHFMHLITLRQPLGPPDIMCMMPHPEQLRAYYKNVQVRAAPTLVDAVEL
jgi:hypothetical protein